MERYVVNVEGAIVREGRYLLIVRGAAEAHAPETLGLPGGKVEGELVADDVLEATLRRELAEEVGVEVGAECRYVESTAFRADDGAPVLDVVFLCRHRRGTPTAGDPEEVAAIVWLTAAEVAAHPQAPPWTRRSITRAEAQRCERGW